MNEKPDGGRTAAAVCNADQPSKDPLCHLEGLWIGDKKEDERAIEGIFGLEGRIRAHTMELLQFRQPIIVRRLLYSGLRVKIGIA